MVRNFLKIALRNLRRNKGFTLTNLLGLTLGITCALFIFLWVKDELTYNRFHDRYENIHVVVANRDFKNRVFTDFNMVLPFARAIEGNHPQIRHAVVTTQPGEGILTQGEIKLKKSGITVSEHFFDVFSWKFIKGDVLSAISDPSSMVITAGTAKALFGEEDPMGKLVKVNNEETAKVTAVIEDLPGNSTLQFDFVQPFNYSNERISRMMSNWGSSSWRLYVETLPGSDIASVDRFIHDLKMKNDPHDGVSTYFTFPMNKWRLYSDFKDGKNTGGMVEYVRLFSVIAIVILLIACVNFMNLSTARSERRSKEVGIRKALGSARLQLIFQFFTESVIMVAIAFVLSVLVVLALMGPFNSMVDKSIVLNPGDATLWLGGAAIVLFTGLVAGSYPALYLSSFSPVRILKGIFSTGERTVLPRHVLVVFQFSISIVLMVATIIVYQQIQHIKKRETGYNADNLVMIPMTGQVSKSYTAIKQELVSGEMVASLTRTSSPITSVWWKSGSPDWNGKPADLSLIISGLRTDVDFSKTMGVKMLDGNDFTGMPSDSGSVLLNKAAVEAMNLKEPLGMEMRFGEEKYVVIGVTDDIVMESPFQPVDPMLVFYNPNATAYVSIRVKEGVLMADAIRQFDTVFSKYNPDFPFDYSFADAEFEEKFVTENLIEKVTGIFAGLAIFICCIGLAGLASFTIERRFREIGIRKVLGASVSGIVKLLSLDFIRLVLIAAVIASPVAWYAMNQWLEDFVYRIDIGWWVFVSVGFAAIAIALLTVSLQAIRAAIANPVNSLRAE